MPVVEVVDPWAALLPQREETHQSEMIEREV